jgi:cytochrome bd-type quinol oxidase subunit 2
MVAHVRTWRRAVGCAATREELDYRRRQYRRRMQTSAMLAVLAVALFVGEWLTGEIASRWFAIVYWLATLVVVGWVGLLALADVLATKIHYDRIRHGYVIERAKLEAELRRFGRSQGNDQSDSDASSND